MRLRFTIRDLFWLTAVVALSVGWWLDHTDLKWTTAKNRDFEAACKAKVQVAESLADGWKSTVSRQNARLRRLQVYFSEKHPGERIDWDTVDTIQDPYPETSQ